jgi:hypothetical protein
MRQLCETFRQPRDARPSTSKELVWREVDAVDRCFLQVDDRMRRMLDRIVMIKRPGFFARARSTIVAMSSFAPEMFDAYMTLSNAVSSSTSETIASTSTPPVSASD